MSIITKSVSWEGQQVFVRTVTYHYVGLCILQTDEYLVLTKAAWVSDSGRWGEAMATGNLNEVEVYPPDQEVALSRGAIVETTAWDHDLPTETK